MTQAISAEAAGTYTVLWLANGADGHPVQGDFTFSSSGGSPCPGEEPENEEPAAGGGNKSSGNADSGSSQPAGGTGTVGTSDGDETSQASGNGDRSTRDHNNHPEDSNGRGSNEKSRGSGDQDGTTGPVAQARSGVPDAPSAIEGIPMGGLVMTLVVAALIGAAAGKIYVSLSGDE
jgi:hypothetical protein